MASSGKEQLLVHASGPQWSWLLTDRSGRTRRTGRCAPDQPDWPEGTAMTVLVDAASCIGIRVELPPMSAARQAKALRWAAEEQLATSAEDEHVVAGPRDDQGRLCCLVINESRLEELHQALAGASVERVLPDALCLPWQRGEVVMTRLGDRILARWGDWEFGSFEPDLLDDLMNSLDDSAENWVWYGDDVPDSLTSYQPEQRTGGGLAALAGGAANAPVNLLSGRFASSSMQAARSYWRHAAIALAVLVALVLIQGIVELQVLKSRSSDLQQQVDAQFYQAFPGITPAGRYRELAERELARLRFGEAAGLLDLMNRAAPVIAGQEAVVMDALSFRDGQLEFMLRAPDVPALEALVTRLKALDLRAEVQSASMDADGASGRVRLSQGGGS